MEKLSQEYVLNAAFTHSIGREELLIEKYSEYSPGVRDNELNDMLVEFIRESQEHIRMLKDKMIKLNIQG